MTSRSTFVALALLAALFSSCAVIARGAGSSQPQNAPAITFAPSADDLIAATEDSLLEKRKIAHAKDVSAGRERAYVVVLTGKDFGEDEFRIAVRINGAAAPDIMLHNSTAFSFRIPTHMVLDKKLMDTSVVEIHIGSDKLTNVPLKVLERALVKVDLDEYKDRIIRQRLGMEESRSRASEVEEEAMVLADEPEEDTAATDGGQFSPHEEPSTDGQDVQDTDGAAEGEEKRKQRQLDERVSEAEDLLAKGTRAEGEAARRILSEAVAQGDVRAMTMYGTASLSGTAPSIPRNFTRGIELITLASDKGYPDAQAMLAFAYASGIAGDILPKNVGAALLLWSVAAEGGSMYAKMAIGYRRLSGTDLKEDCEKASEYYKQVATDVFMDERERAEQQTAPEQSQTEDDDLPQIRSPTPSAIFTAERSRLNADITQRVLGEANEYVQYYRHMADRGHAALQVQLGNLYFHGAMGIQPDLKKARSLFQKGAAKGRTDAHAHLGFMYLRFGWHDKAVFHLQKAASGGDKLGFHGMGFVTLRGIGVEKDPEKAFQFFKKAAELEYPEAMFNLAIMSMRGVGTTHSFNDAFVYFRNAADFGHVQSNFYLGQMSFTGNHPAKKVCSTASGYFKIVAEQGVWNKIFSKAYRAYERGEYASALFWYLFAGHAGIELAQYNAGFMYERNALTNSEGIGPAPWKTWSERPETGLADRSDVVEEALELYQMSASQGYSDSLVRVGDLVFGESQDYPRAASAYERAVKQRNPEAMFNLGWMHARGLGMNHDKHMAKRYFDQARETEKDAFWPATIALYSLKYSDSLFKFADMIRSYLEPLSTASEQYHPSGQWVSTEFHIAGLDVLLLSALTCALVWVVRKRQERLGSADLRSRGARDQSVEDEAPPLPPQHLHEE